MLAREIPVRNRLLRTLPADDLDVIRRDLVRVPLKPRRVLHHWNTPMEHAYFVETGLVSVSARTDPDDAVEVWLIGCEGMTGVPVVLGGDDAPPHRRIVQVEGSALRMSSVDLRRAMDQLPAFRNLLLRYVQVVLLQASQAGACRASHALQQRIARWLLMAQDRIEADDLPLTHDLLARLLGVRRASVTESLLGLEERGVVGKARGHIVVVDRPGLEGVACGCYRTIRAEYNRLLQGPGGNGGCKHSPQGLPRG